MAISNGYATLTEMKARLWPNGTEDALFDSLLEQVVTAVSREIDGHTGRRFYAATETRTYTRLTPRAVLMDDLLTVTTLKTDEGDDGTYETTWATTDYHLMPLNAALDSRPYTHLVAARNGRYRFPNVVKGIEIAGSFGYASTTPAVVKEACLIQSARIYLRKDTPFGVTGSAEMGQLLVIPKLDPDVELLLRPMVKRRDLI